VNTIDTLLKEIGEIGGGYLFHDVKISDIQTHILKARLYLSEDLYIQVYRNDRNNITSFTLVVGDERLYGRDEIDGLWHRHPFSDPSTHNGSPEGRRSINLRGFFDEVYQILITQKFL